MKWDFMKRRAEKKDSKRRKRYESGRLYGERIETEAEGEKLTMLFYEGREDKKGLIVTIHGGGFLYNSVYDEDAYCKYINEKTGMNVASLDYTLSYKRQYPTPIYQCDAQMKTLIERGKEKDGPIVLIGHSAGANIAAALILKTLQDKEYGISALVLDYPDLDNYKRGKDRKFYPFTFTNFTLDSFAEIYCADRERRREPFCSPLYADDAELAKFPPTFITKAKGDRLAEDADAFYERLRDCLVSTELFPADMRHGFIEEGMKKTYKGGGKMTRYAKSVTDMTCGWIEEKLLKEKERV